MRIVPDSHPEAFHVLDLLPPSLHLRSLIIVAWMAESELLIAVAAPRANIAALMSIGRIPRGEK
jgi:hypothetical protein